MPDTNIFAIFGLPTGRIYSIVSALCPYLVFADEVPGLLDPCVDLEHAGCLERDIKRTTDSAFHLFFCIARL